MAAGELSRHKLLDNTDQVNTDLIVCENTDRSLLDTYRKEHQRSVNMGETTSFGATIGQNNMVKNGVLLSIRESADV